LSVIICVSSPPSGQAGLLSEAGGSGRIRCRNLADYFRVMCYNNSKYAVKMKYQNIPDVPE